MNILTKRKFWIFIKNWFEKDGLHIYFKKFPVKKTKPNLIKKIEYLKTDWYVIPLPRLVEEKKIEKFKLLNLGLNLNYFFFTFFKLFKN